MMMVVCYDDGEDGGGGSGVVEVARGASGIVDRVDRLRRNLFGVGRKTHRKTFPVTGGGGGGGGSGGRIFWRERESDML
ncbi:hypothetical protein Tco_0036150 [Tanacetum coccineum]